MECCVQFVGTCSWIVFGLEELFVDCVRFGRTYSWIVYGLEEHIRGFLSKH